MSLELGFLQAASVGGAVALASSGDGGGTFWLALFGTICGTAWRSRYWVKDNVFLRRVMREDVIAAFGLFGLAMFTCTQTGWTGWSAFAAAYAGSLIGIETIRRTILRAFYGWVKSWTPNLPGGESP